MYSPRNVVGRQTRIAPRENAPVSIISRSLWLHVVSAQCASREPRGGDLHFDRVILIRLFSSGRIQRQGIKGVRIRDTVINLRRYIIARVKYQSAAMYGE